MHEPELLADLLRDEGYRRAAYPDSRGFLTIGIGRQIDKRLGGGITLEEARYLLAHDVLQVCTDLDRAMPWWQELPEAPRRALANMCFNLGLGRLKQFRRMLAALECGDYEQAARQALESKWAGQVGPGRAGRIAALYRSGGG